MRIEIGFFGIRVPVYDSLEENLAAIRHYREGNYGELSCDEVAYFRQCEEDPHGDRWEREHAQLRPRT